MSNYPPGVTGGEFEIAGADYERDYEERCHKCGEPMMEKGYRGERWVECYECGYEFDLPYIVNSDDEFDRRKEKEDGN